MNHTLIQKVLGVLLICEGGILIIPLLIAVFFRESCCYMPFIIAIFTAFISGGLLNCLKPESTKIGYKEGFAIVTFGWLLTSIIGALPFYFGGILPSYLDALFETVSGFTTTGATVLNNVEAIPYSFNFWRCFTHWIGGMGILVLTLAVSPSVGGSFQVLKAESPGPMSNKKIAPSVAKTAQILYGTYIIITLLEIILLYFGGMSLFDAVIHTFATVGTGGFSSKNQSIGAYNSLYIEIVVAVFMVMSGTNFSLYFHLYNKKSFNFFKNEEFRFYIIVIAISIAVISINLFGNVYSSIGQSLRYAMFQVSSIITTTGFATADFDLWPDFSKGILMLLMFFGGCAGSTAGSIKHIRILMLIKNAKREMLKVFHPNAVMSIRIDGKTIPDEVMQKVTNFFFLFISIFFIMTLLVALQGLDLISAASSVAATLGNVGPGLGLVGPTMNYGGMTALTKILLIICMLIGRLELYTVLVLFMPSFWRN
ncbi:MAG TPA: TrkH family potassium uptake protein [Thermoanaerobacterales bacterium]|nr:TrkH family potassium uptake protein [Thermoanaerobacterales bacterium]